MQLDLGIEIININAEEIRPLRHAELRQGEDFSSTSYLRDNDKETFHMACIINRKVITCATFYPEITDKRLSKKESRNFESLPVENISLGFSCSIIFFIEKNVIKFERKYS